MDKLEVNCKRCKKDNFFSMEDLKSSKEHFCKKCGALILSYYWGKFRNWN